MLATLSPKALPTPPLYPMSTKPEPIKRRQPQSQASLRHSMSCDPMARLFGNATVLAPILQAEVPKMRRRQVPLKSRLSKPLSVALQAHVFQHRRQNPALRRRSCTGSALILGSIDDSCGVLPKTPFADRKVRRFKAVCRSLELAQISSEIAPMHTMSFERASYEEIAAGSVGGHDSEGAAKFDARYRFAELFTGMCYFRRQRMTFC